MIYALCDGPFWGLFGQKLVFSISSNLKCFELEKAISNFITTSRLFVDEKLTKKKNWFFDSSNQIRIMRKFQQSPNNSETKSSSCPQFKGGVYSKIGTFLSRKEILYNDRSLTKISTSKVISNLMNAWRQSLTWMHVISPTLTCAWSFNGICWQGFIYLYSFS